VGARPTFEINGIWGGYQGEGLKTVLPCEAHAKVSMRLVPNQRPQKIGAALRQFLRDNTPPYAHVKVTHLGDNGLPVLTNLDSPYVRVAADAVREVFGKPAVLALEGGSVPVLADLQRTLKSEPILLGFGLPDDNLHAPNEKFDLRMFDKGVRTVARFLSALGE